MTAIKNIKQKFVIIDGNAIIHRAYHALPPLTTKDGTMVNAVYGFTSMLLKVLHELKPEYLAVSFDVSGPTFRDKLYDKYKATRVKADQDLYDQIPLVYKVVEAFDIPIYTKEGFEADDVIGTIVNKCRMKNEECRISGEIIIVTGDMDLLQLVDDEKVFVYLLRKGLSDIELYNGQKVKERFGFGPERLVDYKALRGDASDNIPGVKGIGEKTAKELIEKIGGVEEIYTRMKNEESTFGPSSSRGRMKNQLRPLVLKKLEDGEAAATLSKELATIRRDVPGLDFSLAKTAVHAFDLKKIKDLFAKCEFFSLLARVPGQKDLQTTSPHSTTTHKKRSFMVVTSENVEVFLSHLKKEKHFVCREVLSGGDVFTSELLGFVFVTYAKSYYVDWKKVEDTEAVLRIFKDDTKILVGHDVKQLIKTVQLHDGEVNNQLLDVMVASYLINSSTRAHDLKSIILRELGEELPAASDQGSLFGADPQVVARELSLIWRLYEKFQKDLQKMGSEKVFNDIEMKLIPILAEMELHGVAIDEAKLRELSLDVAKAIDRLTHEIWRHAGEEFNVSSSVQLRDILFGKMRLTTEGIKKGKTGYSTAASELDKLRGIHPIIDSIEEHRELTKLQNTYIDVLPTLVNKKTKRIHTSFNQAVAATGRLSSSDPNLQNIPIRTSLGREVRRAFVAEPGHVLISADYSQIELRIAAHLANDKKMMHIFHSGQDFHIATAAAIHGVPLEAVTREMRYAAKEVNFGVLYGMGAYGLAWRSGISQGQARDFITKYFTTFAGLKAWIDATLSSAKQTGYVETMFGRRRYIPELQSKNFQLRSSGERMAVNMPIQGTAADIMKLAMIGVHEKIKEPKYKKSEVKMILQVHDELVLEVKKGLEKAVATVVQEAMAGVVQLCVPTEVHVSCGERWGELK